MLGWFTSTESLSERAKQLGKTKKVTLESECQTTSSVPSSDARVLLIVDRVNRTAQFCSCFLVCHCVSPVKRSRTPFGRYSNNSMRTQFADGVPNARKCHDYELSVVGTVAWRVCIAIVFHYYRYSSSLRCWDVEWTDSIISFRHCRLPKYNVPGF